MEKYVNITTAISTFIGFAGGVMFNIFCTWFLHNQKIKKLKKQFAIECKINSEKIDKWIQTYDELQSYVNAEDSSNFHGFFDYTSFLFNTINTITEQGELYEVFSPEQILFIQDLLSTFNSAITSSIQSRTKEINPSANIPDLISYFTYQKNVIKEYRKKLEKFSNEFMK
jgi:hypothetical protein